jgi:diguanylate cyclase (GGDEF)-like protein/PAS domain S-box-containing protein
MRRMTWAVPAVLLAVGYTTVPRLSELGNAAFNLYNLSALLSAATVVGMVVRHRPRPLGPWLLIAVAMVLWVVGDVIDTVMEITSGGSIPDVFYVAAYGCLIVSLIKMLRARVRHNELDSLIDAGLVACSGMFIAWELIIEPAWGSAGTSALSGVVGALYPVLDVVLLVLLVQLLLVRGRFLPAIVWLAAGVAAVFAADVAYAVLQESTYLTIPSVARWVDGTWLMGYALFALAAAHPSMRDVSAAVDIDVRFGFGRLFAAGSALVAAPLGHVLALQLHDDADVESLLLGTVSVVPLVLWRIVRLHGATQRALAEVARRETYYRAVAMKSSDAFVVVDEAGRIIDASDALESLLSVTTDLAIGSDAMSIVIREDRELAHALMIDAWSKPGTTLTGEVRAHTGDGRVICMQLRITSLLDDPAVRGIVINAHDISEQKRVEDELSHQAFHDSLTGLPNRSLLRDRIDHALVSRGPVGEAVTLLFCDLDGFKLINDAAGHDAGDKVLNVVADRLRRIVRPADTVARLGGDEFVVLLEHSTREEATAIAARITQSVADPIDAGGTSHRVTVSVGLAAAALGELGGSVTADDLLRDADIAMYGAKVGGRNRVVSYEPSMREDTTERRILAADLVGALERGEFEAYYQPIVNLHDGSTVGCEALIRWNHPTRGQIAPVGFVGLAEESGAIIPIGAWMLRAACAFATTWPLPADGPPLKISVNLSPVQIADATIVGHVLDALQSTRLDPARLILELTESVLVDNPVAVASRLHELSALGIRLAIDDFGVGYSSLSYLRQFPFDILKIDRSFIDGINDPKELPAIVRGLLDLGRTLHLDVVAEGVEDDIQRRALVNEGCAVGQGYYFARPMTALEAAAFVEAGEATRPEPHR